MSLCNVASVSIVSEEHFTRKNSFDVGLGAETSQVEEFSLDTGMKVHTVNWGVKGIGQEEREEKIPKSVGAMTRPS